MCPMKGKEAALGRDVLLPYYTWSFPEPLEEPAASLCIG